MKKIRRVYSKESGLKSLLLRIISFSVFVFMSRFECLSISYKVVATPFTSNLIRNDHLLFLNIIQFGMLDKIGYFPPVIL